jgi:hypothetical protein
MKNKSFIIISVIIGVLLISSVLAYFVFIKGHTTNLVEVNQLFDANGNPISTAQSVIGGIEGVKYITLKINVENKDTVTLNLKVKNSTSSISSSMPTNVLSISAGQKSSWTTDLIDIEPFERTTPNFCVTVESEKIPSLRESSFVSGCVSVKVDPNPSGSFDVGLNSSIGEGTINPGCTESWTCSSFGTCTNSIQTRTCTDSNSCGTTTTKPAESQSCIVELITECNSANVGVRKCYSSNKYQVCQSSGSWSGILSCANACTGQGVCS